MTVITDLANQYYLYIRKDQKPVAWDIYDPKPPIDFALTTYFGKVFQAIEKSSLISGLVFYVTWNEIDELPSYGENVVVFVLGDEWYRIPKYAHKVRAVFKCVGTNSILGCNPIVQPSLLNLLTLIQFLRILLVGVPGRVNYYWHKFKSLVLGKGQIPPIYDIPLGYYNSQDLPIKNIADRLYDTYFSGSVIHRQYPIWSFKSWLGTPKALSRKLMLSTLKSFQEKHPEFNIELSITGGYHNRTQADERSYSEIMMDTKICLVPRGTSFETTRLFEGMKYGCVLVTEALPSRWYLEGAPVIKIKNWQELPEVLKNLLENKELMEEMHYKSLIFWRNKCSEAVVAEYVIEKLNKEFTGNSGVNLDPP
ncbi:glycosyltransferase family 47 protein [Sphaerospermopsis torques-reginae]|uniref:Glycosyltransferase family 47 protein n=1 Tax=Sphaerospermopsis torques-reginae ITEP-024 TaxID=984208 RepID=A0ABX8X4T4_9CYAN|nr:glycosyltransferase family 47 protein [Sphaerospermopsis torques-reginae]QYX33709.1 glycosyltransferase family 47 protein [Sphaerospermopsis torques-reginae ITEP-024]